MLLRWAIACACLAFAYAAAAATFTANPVRLFITPGTTSTSLQLDNRDESTVLVQAQVMAWSQQDGKDVLTPTDELVVSPPIFKVPPNGAQTVRIGVLRAADADRELTYRLFLQEVPPPQPPGRQTVAVAMRLGLPVFVQPRAPAEPRLVWRIRADRSDLQLSLTNSGNAHVQVLDCTVTTPGGAIVAEQQLAAYVLAGQTRSWHIKPTQPWPGGAVRLKARTGSGDVNAEITPE